MGKTQKKKTHMKRQSGGGDGLFGPGLIGNNKNGDKKSYWFYPDNNESSTSTSWFGSLFNKEQAPAPAPAPQQGGKRRRKTKRKRRKSKHKKT